MKTSKKLFFAALFMLLIATHTNAQGYQYCIVTITNTQYSQGDNPLTSIRSNAFKVPLTDTKYGVKVDEGEKRLIRWQYFNYLYKNYPDALNVFKGGFRESTLWLHIKSTEKEATDTVFAMYGKGYSDYNHVSTTNFKYQKNNTKPNWKTIMLTLRGYLTDGKSLDEISID